MVTQHRKQPKSLRGYGNKPKPSRTESPELCPLTRGEILDIVKCSRVSKLADNLLESYRQEEELVQVRMQNFLVDDTILLLSWATVYGATAKDHPPSLNLVLGGLAFVSMIYGIFWILLAHRDRKFLSVKMDIACSLEEYKFPDMLDLNALPGAGEERNLHGNHSLVQRMKTILMKIVIFLVPRNKERNLPDVKDGNRSDKTDKIDPKIYQILMPIKGFQMGYKYFNRTSTYGLDQKPPLRLRLHERYMKTRDVPIIVGNLFIIVFILMLICALQY